MKNMQDIRIKMRELGTIEELRARRKELRQEGKEPKEIREILFEEFKSVLEK